MMEDSTLHHVYNTPWALPCTVHARSWSILRDLVGTSSDLRSVSHDSTLTVDSCSLTSSDEGCNVCYTHNCVAPPRIALR